MFHIGFFGFSWSTEEKNTTGSVPSYWIKIIMYPEGLYGVRCWIFIMIQRILKYKKFFTLDHLFTDTIELKRYDVLGIQVCLSIPHNIILSLVLLNESILHSNYSTWRQWQSIYVYIKNVKGIIKHTKKFFHIPSSYRRTVHDSTRLLVIGRSYSVDLVEVRVRVY